MGRSEAPLNPGQGPVQQFAHDLRQLRNEAGRPTYRVLAERARYSVAALSQAASGHSLPSLPVTLGFVRACGGDPDEWERRWHAVNDALRSEQAILPGPAEPATRRRPTRWAIAVVAAVCVIVGTALWLRSPSILGTAGHPAPSTAAFARPCVQRTVADGGPEDVADCSDPGRSGCGPGAITLAFTEVRFPADQLSGYIQLRYSPKCQTAWGRFEPADTWKPGPGTMVKVWTLRPADKAVAAFEWEFGTQAIIGDMLLTRPGCVIAEVTMARGAERSPTATTPCMPVSN